MGGLSRVNEQVTDRDWERLLARILDGKCTPFLGAGASVGTLPLGGDVARRWAAEEGYPLEDEFDLARVAQFVSINGDPMWPKEKICTELRGLGPPDFDRPGEPHAALAELPISLYVTTNYDDFMIQALRGVGKSPLGSSVAGTSSCGRCRASSTATGSSRPSTSRWYIHLHGTLDVPESIVLTEDDYLDFLVAVSRREDVLPPQIQGALASTSLLFLGYKLADANFRVLHRGLISRSPPGSAASASPSRFRQPTPTRRARTSPATSMR